MTPTENLEYLTHLGASLLEQQNFTHILKFCSPKTIADNNFDLKEIQLLSHIIVNSPKESAEQRRFWLMVKRALRANLIRTMEAQLSLHQSTPFSEEFIVWQTIYELTSNPQNTMDLRAILGEDGVDSNEVETEPAAAAAEILAAKPKIIELLNKVQMSMQLEEPFSAKSMKLLYEAISEIKPLHLQVIIADLRISDFWEAREAWKIYDTAILQYLLASTDMDKKSASMATELYICLTQTPKLLNFLKLLALGELVDSNRETPWSAGVIEALNKHAIYLNHLELLEEVSPYTEKQHAQIAAGVLATFVKKATNSESATANQFDADEDLAIKLRMILKHYNLTSDERFAFRLALERVLPQTLYPNSLNMMRRFHPYQGEFAESEIEI